MSRQDVLNRPYDFRRTDTVNDITFDPQNDGAVYMCFDQIIRKTVDGGDTWFTVFDTLATSFFWELDINPDNGDELLACAFDSLCRTLDGGQTWQTFSSTPGGTPPMKNMVIDWQSRILYVSTYNPFRGVFMLYF